MIKAIFFDLDGTLLNTLEDIRVTLNKSLSSFGMPEISSEQTKEYVGNGARLLVERAVGNKPQEVQDKVYSDFSKRFSESSNEFTYFYDGEEKALHSFKKAGIKLIIVTNKPQCVADKVYNKFLSQFDFCKVVGQTQEYPLKPDPAATLAIIKELNLQKEECVFVGDGETDFLTGRAAGIKCISVLWGYRSKAQLQEIGASVFVKDYSELFKTILA